MASPNLSSVASASVTASGSVGSGSRETTDIKAPLWDHVTILERPKAGGGNALWRCNYCPLEKSSSYTRVEAHLLQKSGKGIIKCPKVSYEMLSEMRREVERCKELVERAKTRTVALPVGPSSGNYNKKNKRGPASILEKSWALQDRKHLDALIVRAMYSGGVSFNFLRNPYFREAFAFACSRNLQGYTIPGYNRARESLLKQERRHIEHLLESTKSTWPEKGVTICSDGWSDPQRRPIINFIAVSEKAPMFLRADNCEGEYKSKEYIAEKLRAIIDEVGRQNVVQIITDNAANCKGAGLLIEAEYDHIFWTPCVVHTLNLAMKNICEPKLPRTPTDEDMHVWGQLEFINDVKVEATMIKNFIMNHGMRLSMFNEFSHLKLLSIAETRFASVVCMLKRFVEVKAALQHMVISDKWSIYKEDASTAQHVKEKILSDVWWGNVDYILRITTPIYDMIRFADTDTPCLHLIYEMWDSMIEKVKKEIYLYEGKEPNEESDLYSVIHDILIARWTKGNNPLHCLAHSLNPRFYSNKWLEEGAGRLPPHKDKEVSQMRMTCFKKFFRIPQELAQVKEEYSRFSSCSEEFNDPDSIHDRWAVSPMTWWTNHGQSVPQLMSLAMKLLSQPASSSCCERNWSTYSFIHSVKRNALTPERAEDLVFVHSNLRHLSRRTDAYKTGETMMWDVGGDSFDSLSGVGLLEVADLSIDEPELQAVSFGLGDLDVEENEEAEEEA
ncbi:putative transcriptional regulator tpeD [Miscanthus floridulus]|uniref:putative transcriptional regulator tpeD n=1 Tax=Miscanthus floridulus TaxID=154761 RepID=UPI00345A759D